MVLRPVVEGDIPQLLEILREPEVARFWSEPDAAFDRKELLGGEDQAERCNCFAIEDAAGRLVGWIAGWEKLDRDYQHASCSTSAGTIAS